VQVVASFVAVRAARGCAHGWNADVPGFCVLVTVCGGWGVGWGFIGALLGSEGTHVGVCCLGGGVVWFIRPARVQCCSLVGVWGVVVWVGGWWWVWVGVVCCLRTAQWTRASCFVLW
jgi:hypothetical protein